MTPSIPHQNAVTLKNEGNALFGSGDMYFSPMRQLTQCRKGAIQKYTEAIQLTQTSFLYSNRAAALLKMEEFDAALNDALELFPSPSRLMSRAIELDSTWAKGYSRLAEVYNAQAQYEKAVEAYERAMSLSSEQERTRYQRLHAKMQEKTRDVFYVNGAIYDPARNGNDAMFARFDEAVPDRCKFGTDDQHLTPLGYMTAAHKLYSGYIQITRCGSYDTDGLVGTRYGKLSSPKDFPLQHISPATLFRP